MEPSCCDNPIFAFGFVPAYASADALMLKPWLSLCTLTFPAGSQRDMEQKRDRYAKAMLIAAEISSLTVSLCSLVA